MSRPSWIGQTLGGRYQILEMVGQGGMSAVYKARDPNLQRIVAIKLIHSHLLSDPKFLVRFEEEARAVAQLRHPNIVQVYDYNTDEDISYMVQEFLPGETLQTRLRRLNQQHRYLSLEEVIKISQDILSALGYAHQRGMIHRDIKPANIMLDVHGQAILMDFGIVKITGGESHTATGAVVGTAMYMPPELIRGEQADERSDLYSFGVTLYEMIGGYPPYEADSAMSLMMMHLNDPVPDISNLRPEIPSGLPTMIKRALSKDRMSRFSSAADMGAYLDNLKNQLNGVVVDQATSIDSSAPPGVTDQERLVEVSQTPPPTPVFEVAQSENLGEASTPKMSQSGMGEVRPHPAAEKHASAAELPQGVEATGTSNQGAEAALMSKLRSPYLIYGGLGALLILLVLVGVTIGRMMGGGGERETPLAGFPEETSAGALVGIVSETPEAAFTDTATATLDSTATHTLEPTSTSTITATPTLSALPQVAPPVDRHFARINAINLDEQNRYVVDYETFGYTEVLPGEHVHFFFNTVAPEQAGHPGSGPWFLYGGPRPFMEYNLNSRPTNAAAMCSLVANPDHSVQAESGNCWPLPNMAVLVALEENVCYAYPAEGYSQVATLPQWSMLLVRGRLPEGGWWFVQNPTNLGESCWVSTGQIYLSGDLTLVPDSTPMPATGGSTSP